MRISDEEIINSEPYRRGEKIAESLAGLSNGGTYREARGFVEHLLHREHRTLQQKTVSLMLEFLCRLADQHGDARNEAAIQIAGQIRDMLVADPHRLSSAPWKLPLI